MHRAKKLRSVLDAEGWAYITRAAQGIPVDFDPRRYPSNPDLIRGLGCHGALGAIMVLQDALDVYFSDIIFAGLRATLMQSSMGGGRLRLEPVFTEEKWREIFEVPWNTSG